MLTIPPPTNISELSTRINDLAGKSLLEIAQAVQIPVPTNLKSAKGWIGQLLECALGATAGSKAIHDFPDLGIELKTIPLNKFYRPLESTYICTAPLTMAGTWEQSWVCRKLQHVLWVPIAADPSLSIAERRITNPFFWQPTSAQQQILQQDWEELTELLHMGGITKLSAKYGTYLHIRPKAANSTVLVAAFDEDSNLVQTVPKGFYLRSSFTQSLITN